MGTCHCSQWPLVHVIALSGLWYMYMSLLSMDVMQLYTISDKQQCIRDKDTTIVQLKHELAGMQDNTQQPVLFTQSPVLRRSSSRVSRRPQSCLDLISVDNKL